MVPAPPEVSQWRGLSKRRYCAAHIWCWPTSVETIASRPAMARCSDDMRCCGRISSVDGVKARQSSARQRSMRAHHGASRSGANASGSNPSSASTMAPQSPTIGTSTCTTLLMLPGSMSMWILRACGQNSSSLPVTRSSKRAPTHTTRSASCIARLASSMPCMPSMPTNFGSDAGNAPNPISVSVHGACSRCTSCVNASQAAGPELMSPPPP
ncbi:hypothetical protein D3C72_1062430 [compost metagenome]